MKLLFLYLKKVHYKILWHLNLKERLHQAHSDIM